MGFKYLENLLKTISSYWPQQATKEPRPSGSHIKRYLSKYERTLLKEQQGDVFDGLPLSPLEVAYSEENEGELGFEADVEPDFRPLVEVIVEIQQADRSYSAGSLILNSDAALDIARQGVGPVRNISVDVTIIYGGIPLVGTPVRVKAIFSHESLSGTDKPVEQPLASEKKLKFQKRT